MAGYASIAATLSLSKGVSFGDDGLTGANAARLIFNTLNTPVMKQTTYGAEERYERDKDSLLMNIRLDIYEERGVVTANALADIDGLNMSKGSVKIDGVRYLEGSSGAGLLFGRNVKFYYLPGSRRRHRNGVICQGGRQQERGLHRGRAGHSKRHERFQLCLYRQ